MVHEGQEKERYKQLTLEFMSAESSSDEGAITVHKPEWRSESKSIAIGSFIGFICCCFFGFFLEFVKFLEVLDKRADDARKEGTKHVPERKARLNGTALTLLPPSDAPKWTIDKNWLKGV